jgi:hypothetical protein
MGASPSALVDECLGAEDDGEGEPFGVLGAGFGGVDRDPQVVAGDDEGVAVQRDEADIGVVDYLVPGLILGRADLAGGPQLGEARAAPLLLAGPARYAAALLDLTRARHVD